MSAILKSHFSSFVDDPQFDAFSRIPQLEYLSERLETHRTRLVGTTLVIHDKDPDGYCSAALLRYGIEILETPGVVFEGVGHGKAFQNYVPRDTQYETILVLDHAVTPEKRAALLTKTGCLVVFDHHVESGGFFQLTPGEDYLGYVHKDYSTTALVYGWLLSLWRRNVMLGDPGGQAIASLVDHYDKWRFGTDLVYDEKVHAFIGLVFLKGFDSIPWDRLVESGSPCAKLLVDLIAEGRELKVMQDLQVENVCKRYTTYGACIFDEEPRTFAIVFHSDLFDRIASRLIEQNPGLDFVVIVALKKTTTPVKLYLRSRDDRMDVQRLAAFLGGGGHRNASGAELTFAQLPLLLAKLNAAI